jgi:iron complex transport system ATP-binding protein
MSTPNRHAMGKALLAVSELAVAAHGTRLLRDISFALDAGDILAILGANGAGKSTLVSALSAGVVPDVGQITLDDRRLADWSLTGLAERRALNASEPAIPFAMSVEECVALGRPFVPVARDEVVQALHDAHATQWATRDYATLSMGEQTRVQIARSLYQLGDTPRCLWLLDEPCAHLDLAQRQFVLALIARIAKARQWAVVFTTHDPAEAAQIADRALLLRSGAMLCCAASGDALTEENLSACYGVKVVSRTGFVAG